jgi:hypothetical protein
VRLHAGAAPQGTHWLHTYTIDRIKPRESQHTHSPLVCFTTNNDQKCTNRRCTPWPSTRRVTTSPPGRWAARSTSGASRTAPSSAPSVSPGPFLSFLCLSPLVSFLRLLTYHTHHHDHHHRRRRRRHLRDRVGPARGAAGGVLLDGQSGGAGFPQVVGRAVLVCLCLCFVPMCLCERGERRWMDGWMDGWMEEREAAGVQVRAVPTRFWHTRQDKTYARIGFFGGEGERARGAVGTGAAKARASS